MTLRGYFYLSCTADEYKRIEDAARIRGFKNSNQFCKWAALEGAKVTLEEYEKPQDPQTPQEVEYPPGEPDLESEVP